MTWVKNLDQKARYDSRFTKQNLDLSDKQKLVSVFAWLIQEDKKQNPEIYSKKKIIQND